MKYYRFKTFTTSYYFPSLNKEQQYMYGLYSAYGSKLSKIYWSLFKKWRMIRELTAVKEKRLPFPYRQIKEADGSNCLMSFNMGSPGIEQKISILGYDKDTQRPFFAKFSQKKAAIKLTQNEIAIYQTLSHAGITPRLIACQQNQQFVYMKTEYIKGERPKSKEVTTEVLDLCYTLKGFHLTHKKTDEAGLQLALSHGDFCPWNMLYSDKKMKLIDWELAADRPLGYDLFTYICQVSALFYPGKELIKAIDENMIVIKQYFKICAIENYLPYLKAFAREKVAYEQSKGNTLLYEKYNKLYSLIIS